MNNSSLAEVTFLAKTRNAPPVKMQEAQTAECIIVTLSDGVQANMDYQSAGILAARIGLQIM